MEPKLEPKLETKYKVGDPVKINRGAFWDDEATALGIVVASNYSFYRSGITEYKVLIVTVTTGQISGQGSGGIYWVDEEFLTKVE